MTSRRPWETRNNRSMPNSWCTMRSSRTQSGLRVHWRPTPRGFVFFSERFAHEAAMIDFSYRQFRGLDGDLLIGARGAVIGAEGEIDQQHVKSEEAEDRPSAQRHEDDAGDKAQASQAEHKDEEALWTKRTMR